MSALPGSAGSDRRLRGRPPAGRSLHFTPGPAAPLTARSASIHHIPGGRGALRRLVNAADPSRPDRRNPFAAVSVCAAQAPLWAAEGRPGPPLCGSAAEVRVRAACHCEARAPVTSGAQGPAGWRCETGATRAGSGDKMDGRCAPREGSRRPIDVELTGSAFPMLETPADRLLFEIHAETIVGSLT